MFADIEATQTARAMAKRAQALLALIVQLESDCAEMGLPTLREEFQDHMETVSDTCAAMLISLKKYGVK